MESLRLFRKNKAAGSSLRKPTSSAVHHRLVKLDLGKAGSLQNVPNSVDYPGLSFIDADDAIEDLLLSNNLVVEKVLHCCNSSNDNIECQPKKSQILRNQREFDSPTKSLQHLDDQVTLAAFNRKLFIDNSRRSSLCVLASLKAAAKSSPLSGATSLSSMISLPGVPPVPGVNEAEQVQVHLKRQKTKKVHDLIDQASLGKSPRLQSEEDLILNIQRKQEFNAMRPTKLKEESDILQNIRKREMLDKINKEGSVEKREKEEKKKLHHQFDIASGILKTKSLFLAPLAATVAEENDYLIPPPSSDHPNQRRIVRRVVSARLYQSPELIVQAETRFADSIFVQECLEVHNTLRKKHLAPCLTLDLLLCATAQHWANLLAHKDEFYYQNPPHLGENLFAWLPPAAQQPVSMNAKKKKPDVSGEDAALYWYKSHSGYAYDKEPRVLHAHAGPFTQLVWHSSQKFGCGKARSRSGKVIVVAYYEPRGNIPEQFHDNVLPPVQEESSSCDDNDIENSFTITEINDKHDSSKPPTPSISKRHLFFNLITCK